MAKIKNVFGLEVVDSRSNPTIMAIVQLDNNIVAKAIAPAGASKGKNEALELRDGTKRLNGLGVKKSVSLINNLISKKLKGINIFDQELIDSILIELDGTANMAKIGSNTAMAVSLACIKAAAAAKKVPLYKFLNKKEFVLPIPFMNVINGGVHAGNDLSIQEFMIVPKNFKTFSDAFWAAVEVYHSLKTLIKNKYSKTAINVGDEGGFAPPLSFTTQALDLLLEAIELYGFNKKIFLAIDAAANSFFDQKQQKYFIDKKMLSSQELLDYWVNLIKSYPIISIEDPFEESAYFYYAQLKNSTSIQVVADDITVSNLKLVKKAYAQNALTTLLLKINQVGTLSQAIETADYASKNNLNIMLSHRSGETEDNVLSDLVVGLGYGLIKTGAPARGERTAKYNRLLEIEFELNISSQKSKFGINLKRL